MKRIRFRKKQTYKKPNLDIYPVNEKIRVPEVKVIDETGQMLGVMATAQALSMAKERDLDLVAVSPKAQPPVARFLDYGTFKYQKEKAAKKQKLQQKKTDIKEIRLSPRIGKHDLDVRLNQVDKFLKKGNKVNIEIILKGRERQHPEIAKEVISDFIKKIQTDIMEIIIEQEPKRMGNKFIAIIFPSNKQPKEDLKEELADNPPKLD